MEWIFVKQIIAETADEERSEFMNLVNLNTVKRIAFIKGKDEAELYFYLPSTVIKTDQFEDSITIEVKDKKGFVEKLAPILRAI